MQLYFCGVRGSMPALGAAFTRYGGHTSCLALAHDGEPPSLVIDAGTGLQTLTTLLGDQPFQGSVLLGHLHWDHVHGMPFFKAGAEAGHRVDVLLPAIGGDAAGTLARGMSPPHFPVRPEELGPGWSFGGLEPGSYELEGFAVLVHEIPHKGGRTFGFRVDDGTGAIAYLSDHDPLLMGPGPDGLGAYHAAALELAHDVEVLVYDAQFLAAEFPEVAHLGHSAVEYAVGLAEAARADRLVLFHHAPDRTDEQIDAVLASLPASAARVSAAADGDRIATGWSQLSDPAVPTDGADVRVVGR